MKIKAYAKINLNLLVLDKREDGLHDIKSVFQKIDLYDELEIKKNKDSKCKLKCNVKELEEDNLLLKAYELLKEVYPSLTGVDIYLNKKIPMEAGLGGGSSDVGAFLIVMNKLFKLGMKEKDFKKYGMLLGSDVYPCCYNVPVLLDVGDKLKVINSNLSFHLLVIKPKSSCNTCLMYKKLDEIKRNKQDTTKGVIKALENNNLELLIANLYNSFEEVVDFNLVKKDLISNGALGTLLSGSGSCVFGIYENKKKAREAFNKLKNKYEIYLCKSINKKDLDI
jgi:4-diphosphocytidyl-2-C-methyl-D-erythritol kinase